MTRRFLRNLLVTLLLGSCAALPASGAAGKRVIDDFEAGLNARWEPKHFSGTTEYRVVAEGREHVLQAVSQAAASGLVYKIDFDPAEYRILSWRWKIDRILAKGDATTRSGDDYAARLYVIFPHWLFFKTRSLNYIWANRLPRETLQPNSYTGNAMMIAVESGDEKAGEWVTEQRDLVADYRRAFGEDPPQAGAIALMTDTDNTGERAVAWYDDIVLVRDRQPSRSE